MAEHKEQEIGEELFPFNNMGKPVPFERRQSAYKNCRHMGLNQARAYECVDAMAEQLKRDEPYMAQKAGMQFLDLTGTYRIMAVLLAEPVEEGQE